MGFRGGNGLSGSFLARPLVVSCRMPDVNQSFYDCRREGETPAGHLSVQFCSLWLRRQGIEYKSIHGNADGTLRLNLSGLNVCDLNPLTILPLTHLCLAGCWRIADFTPLRKLGLVWLNLTRTGITNLSPLRNLPLAHLSLCRTRVADLSPMTRVPLRVLDIRSTQVTRLFPLRQMPLEEMYLYPSRVSNGLQSLRSIGTLTRINRCRVEDFWERYGNDGLIP
jgi:hypothetical protein